MLGVRAQRDGLPCFTDLERRIDQPSPLLARLQNGEAKQSRVGPRAEKGRGWAMKIPFTTLFSSGRALQCSASRPAVHAAADSQWYVGPAEAALVGQTAALPPRPAQKEAFPSPGVSSSSATVWNGPVSGFALHADASIATAGTCRSRSDRQT